MDYDYQLRLQKILNGIISCAVILFFLLCTAYALFALWDNRRIYQAAENVQADMLQLKPQEEGPSFGELLDVNPEVRAWLSMEKTNIDFPVLQGENNLCYINKDVYGNFSLAGSIFLDYRNSPQFTDRYNLLYGHHMEGSNMFGDLDRYKQEKFFRDHPNGRLILPDTGFRLRAFALLLVTAADEVIFSPQLWTDSPESCLAYVKENAVFLDEQILSSLGQDSRILAMTTCSGEFTDARTVLLAVMESNGQ